MMAPRTIGVGPRRPRSCALNFHRGALERVSPRWCFCWVSNLIQCRSDPPEPLFFSTFNCLRDKQLQVFEPVQVSPFPRPPSSGSACPGRCREKSVPAPLPAPWRIRRTVRLSAPRSWMSRLSGRISDTSLSECLAAKVQMTSWILSRVRVIIVFPQKSECSFLWRHWHLRFVTQFLEVCIFWKAEGLFRRA